MGAGDLSGASPCLNATIEVGAALVGEEGTTGGRAVLGGQVGELSVDVLEVELETGAIKNVTRGRVFQAKPYPEFMLELIAAGGLIEHTRKKLKAKGVIR